MVEFFLTCSVLIKIGLDFCRKINVQRHSVKKKRKGNDIMSLNKMS